MWYNENLYAILYMMANREFEVSERTLHGFLPDKQRSLRWTVEKEAHQMAHIFDDLSTVHFNMNEKGVIRLRSLCRASQACLLKEDFNTLYQDWRNWDYDVRHLFKDLVHLRAIKLAEVATGIRMDFDWLNTTLLNYTEYPHNFHLQRPSQTLEERIRRGEFDPTEDEVIKLAEVCPDLEKSLDNELTNIYGVVYCCCKAMWHNIF